MLPKPCGLAAMDKCFDRIICLLRFSIVAPPLILPFPFLPRLLGTYLCLRDALGSIVTFGAVDKSVAWGFKSISCTSAFPL